MTLTRNGYLGTAAAMTVISWIAQSSNDNLTFGGFILAPFIGAITANNFKAGISAPYIFEQTRRSRELYANL